MALQRPLRTELYEQKSLPLIKSINDLQQDLEIRKRALQQRRMDVATRTTALRERQKILSLVRTYEQPTYSSAVKICAKKCTSIQNDLNLVSRELSLRRAGILKHISELYPIESQVKVRSVRGFYIPSLSTLRRISTQVIQDEESLSTGIGYLVHRICLAANVVDFPLKLELTSLGSKSSISDFFTASGARTTYPLYIKVCL